jgi:ABC-type nitrate/sulfonate/bicarbonate transport system ATPase subunit
MTPTRKGEVAVENLYFAYGGDLVLEDISFTIESGQFVAIIGPSGCGKSTLLKIIQGLLKPNFGTAAIDGVPVIGAHGDRAMIFQHFALLPWLTVLKNITLGLKYSGQPARVRERNGREYLRLVGLAGSENLYPQQLSGGMQQRVGIARAFATKASVLLLDEPFGALDAQNAEIMREELSRLVRHEGKTAVMVTHNLDEALGLTDRVLVMGARPGVIIEDVVVAQYRGSFDDQDAWPGSEAYRDLRNRLWHTLRAEVLRTQKVEVQEASAR